jgi:hypothetical protein
VFIPAGQYLVSSTLQLRYNTKLFGLNKCYSRIKANYSGSGVATPLPSGAAIMESPNAASQTQLMELMLMKRQTQNCYLLNWRTGPQSVVKSVNFDHRYMFDGQTVVQSTLPLVKVSGAGGGRWYNFWNDTWGGQGVGYRHFMADDNTGALRVYMLNAETEDPDGHGAEFSSTADFKVFQTKWEGKERSNLLLNSCTTFEVHGFSGNAAPQNSGAANIAINSCTNYVLTSCCFDDNQKVPDQPYTLKESVPTFSIVGREAFILHKR